MKFRRFVRWFRSDDKAQHGEHQKGSSGYLIFSGNDGNLMKNGKILLQERISLFNGRTNPIRCFSVDDLNSMNVNNNLLVQANVYDIHTGVWDNKPVLVKIFLNNLSIERACREIAVATQMGNHSNVHRLLGCCLDTKRPVLVYECAENGTLNDRVLRYKEHNKEALKCKDRLRIALEIAHAVAYLHTAFKRPIIHRDLEPMNVYLDQDDSARLSDFSLSISIPKGKRHVELVEVVGRVGTQSELLVCRSVAQSTDVDSFGTLLLVLLTGKQPFFSKLDCIRTCLSDWVTDCRDANKLGDILDPAITTNEPADGPFELQLEELVELALRCTSKDEERRPTMVDVANELNNIITKWSHPH